VACTLILLSLIQFVDAELIMAAEFFRHGARTPIKHSYKTSHSERGKGELTTLGLQQHYSLGKQLRQKYIENLNFLSSTYNSSELHIKSSWKNRSYHSLIAQLYGLYPDIENTSSTESFFNNVFPELTLPPHVKIHLVDQEGDHFFHGKKEDVCPIAQEIIDRITESHEYKQKNLYYQLVLYEELARILNEEEESLKLDPSVMTLKKAKQMLDLYTCNVPNGKEIPKYTEKILAHLRDIHYYLAYPVENGDQILTTVGVSEIFKEMKQFFLNEYRDPEEHDYKMLIYAGHDTNLLSIFSVLMSKAEILDLENSIPPFAASLIFELHAETTENSDTIHYIKILYNDKELLLEKCGKERCNFNYFITILEQYIYDDIKQVCNRSLNNFTLF